MLPSLEHEPSLRLPDVILILPHFKPVIQEYFSTKTGCTAEMINYTIQMWKIPTLKLLVAE
jgi:hypothetical protein